MIQVKILPTEQNGGGQEEGGIPARRGDSKSSAVEPRIEPKSLANPEPQGLPADTVATVRDSGIARISAAVNTSETLRGTIADPTGSEVNGSGSGPGGTGNGSSGIGSGRGSSNSSGSSQTGIALTQARYRDAPRPEYPDSARREGREGRVLLRVLVDDQGRSKQIEINSSSGSDALDRAAAEAIKRWRFHPARYGDKAVESWLRIPIEFRLADAKSW
jgi:protein TonB